MQTAQLWKPTDLSFTSSVCYANPYQDMEMAATFTHASGAKLKINGFWNGGQEWKIRFAPTLTGRWDYQVCCSDKNNAMHGNTGTIQAAPNAGATDIEKHGFLQIDAQKRHFVYADQTPFFWLGDTNWQSFNLNDYYACNYPGCNCQNQFRHILKNRRQKGFNVYQTYFDASGGKVQPEQNMWLQKYEKINPAVFCGTIDKMFQDIADSNMVIALGFGLHFITPVEMSEQALCRFARYITARYAAYPIVWITGQEIDLEQQEGTYDKWKAVAAACAAADPYRHPMSAHMFADPRKVDDLNAQPWHNSWALPCRMGYRRKISWRSGCAKMQSPCTEPSSIQKNLACRNRF